MTSEARRSEAEAWRASALEMRREKLERAERQGSLQTQMPQMYAPKVQEKTLTAHALKREEEASGSRAELASALSSLRRARDDRSHLASERKSLRLALAAAKADTQGLKAKLEASEAAQQRQAAESKDMRARLDRVGMQAHSSVIAMAKLQADRQRSISESRSASRSVLSPLASTSSAWPSVIMGGIGQSPGRKEDSEGAAMVEPDEAMTPPVREGVSRVNLDKEVLRGCDRGAFLSLIQGKAASPPTEAVAWGSSVSRASASSSSPLSRSSCSRSPSVEPLGSGLARLGQRLEGWHPDKHRVLPQPGSLRSGVLSRSGSLRGRSPDREPDSGALPPGERGAGRTVFKMMVQRICNDAPRTAVGHDTPEKDLSEADSTSERSESAVPHRRSSGSILSPATSTDSLCSTSADLNPIRSNKLRPLRSESPATPGA